MNGNGPVRFTQEFQEYVHTFTVAVLAMAIIGIAAWQVVVNGMVQGPFVNWAGIIVGVYFGAVLNPNGTRLKKPTAPPSEPPARSG